MNDCIDSFTIPVLVPKYSFLNEYTEVTANEITQ